MYHSTTIVGRLGKDPEQVSFGNGNSLVKFSVAVTDEWRDRQTQEKRSKTTWYPVQVNSSGLQKVCMQYLKKGSLVFLSGLQYTQSEKDGRYYTQFNLGFNGTLKMLGGKSDGGYGPQSGGPEWDSGGYEPPSGGDLDDEIPF